VQKFVEGNKMKSQLSRLAALCLAALLGAASAAAQVAAAGSLAGTVADQQGAVVAGATVTVRSEATGREFTATTADNGTFNVPSLPAGNYTVTITGQGFKQAVLPGVKVDVGTPSSISVALEVGAPTETVTITGAGGELLQTQSATVGTTITGRQIIDQPQASRDALDLVTLLPGVQTTGRPRTSHVNGLPYGALNITIDGTNVQDNLIKSGDGFFTYVRPRIDAINEVSVSTATPGAESSGAGAVQIRFITRSGTNDLTGSLYWYHRNPALNANYWYRSRDLQPRPGEEKVRPDRVLLNQYGGRVGGPIRIPYLFDGRDRAFFFVNYEEYRLPETQLRQRNVLNTNIFGGATPGNFQYAAGGVTRTVNLLSLAGANGLPSTLDPTVQGALAAIRATLSQGALSASPGSPNLQQFSFTNPGGQERYFPTVRLDWNVTDKHHVENIWNYQRFTGKPVDFLNNADPSFPGFPNSAGQDSHRFTNTTALRSTLTGTIVNEARFSLFGGNSLFGAQVSPAQFDNQGGFDLAFSDSCCGTIAPGTATLLTDVTANGFPGFGFAGTFGNTSSRRNSPVTEFSDTLTWVKGAHTLNFGGNYTQLRSYQSALNQIVPTVYFGVNTDDPANELFDPTSPVAQAAFPGASAAQLLEASQLYALLTGRVTQIFQTAYNNEGTFQLLGPQTTRFRQRQLGLFAQDSWRARPNLTVNFGLRWEPQEAPVAQNAAFSRTTKDDIFGVSGPNSRATQLAQLQPGERLYETDWNNFAPSVGVAYSPDRQSGPLHRFFGAPGQSVIRAGYSVAYVREGLAAVISPVQANLGGLADASLTAGVNIPTGSLLRDRASFPQPAVPQSPTYPIVTDPFNTFGQFVSAFDPDFRTGYVQSWTAGFQRELTRDTVAEVRYVGTRGIKLLRRYTVNEVLVNDPFAAEFRLAQANLAANRAAGRGNTFAYFGPGTGTDPLPIIFAAFNGTRAGAADAAAYTSALFSAGAFVNPLAPTNPNPIGFATTLAASTAVSPTTGDFFINNLVAAGYPYNFFQFNPDIRFGVPTLTDNGQQTWYDALQVEVRRRMSQGLLLQASYTFSKSQGNLWAANTGQQQTGNNAYVTLRDLSLSKRLSPYDQRHAFKVNWIYELPVGRGRHWLGDANGLVDRVLGGWELHGTARVQSGRAFRMGNVRLVGMTREDLQDAIEVRKNASTVTFLPDDIILNTIRAFNTSATSATGYSALGVPEGRFIAPPGFGGCLNTYPGACGFSDLVLHGPRFVRVDMSVVKKVRFTERTNFELRGEFLNALNNQNFFVGGNASTDVAAVLNQNSTAFGVLPTGSAYQDVSTTNDPGGRLVQIVLRFNF
jgi:hypothetical protein